MSKMHDAGITTAYGAAVRGGYEGTYEQFCTDLGELADVLSEFLGFSVTVETLAEGAEARGEYDAGVLSLGIPRGDTGNGIQSIALNADYTLTVTYTNGQTWISGSIRGETGATPNLQIGTVSTLSPGSPATAEITGTRDEPRLNLGIPQGVPGDVPAASIAPAYDASSTYAVGEYVMHNNSLYRCATAITTAEAWTAEHWTAAQIGDDLADCSRHLNDKQDAPATAGTAGQVLGLDSQLNPVWIENGGGSSAWELCSHSTWTMEEGGTEKGNVVLGMTSCYIDEYEFMIVGYAKSSSSAARQITFLTVNQTEAVNPYVWGKTAQLTSAIYNFFATFATDNAILHGEIGVMSSWGNWLVHNISCYTPTISMNYTKKPELDGVHLLRDYINMQLANMIEYDIYLYRRSK